VYMLVHSQSQEYESFMYFLGVNLLYLNELEWTEVKFGPEVSETNGHYTTSLSFHCITVSSFSNVSTHVSWVQMPPIVSGLYKMDVENEVCWSG
jgi:hypothetical protein